MTDNNKLQNIIEKYNENLKELEEKINDDSISRRKSDVQIDLINGRIEMMTSQIEQLILQGKSSYTLISKLFDKFDMLHTMFKGNNGDGLVGRVNKCEVEVANLINKVRLYIKYPAYIFGGGGIMAIIYFGVELWKKLL